MARCEIDPLLIASGPRDASGYAVGHESVAEVIGVGSEVSDIRPGDLVVPSFQLCCGRCESCRKGRSANCDAYAVLSDYGMQPLSGAEYGGMLSDEVRVPHADAMLFPLPPNVDPVSVASAGDNLADGYRAVAPHLAEEPGADVLIVCHGGRSIALYAALAAVALGARTVTFESDDTDALRVAENLGAIPVAADFGRRQKRWPIVVDCGTRVQGLHHAVSSTEPEGVLHSVSYYADPLTGVPLGKMYTLGIRVHIGRVHSATVLPSVLRLVAGGVLKPDAVPVTAIPWEEANDRYLDDAVKLVVTR